MKVAICGKMCSGKTTLANHIMRNFKGYQKYSLAQKVKELCAELFGMKTKDRPLLINFANKMRDIDPDVWINQVLKETKGHTNCIIDDVRYQNEVDALLKGGWTFIQLHIPLSLQRERIMKMYPHDYENHIELGNHISEQNTFVFPKHKEPLSLMVDTFNEQQILHDVNLLLMK